MQIGKSHLIQRRGVSGVVERGFYSNRTDFVITEVRNQLRQQSANFADAAVKHSMTVGALVVSHDTLEELREKGEQMAIPVVGILVLCEDITAPLARATIASVRIRGTFRATAKLKAALSSDRIE